MDVTQFRDINLDGVKTVFSDLDNTLYSYEPCHQFALEKCFEEFNTNFTQMLEREEFYSIYTKCRKDVTSRLSPQGACRSRFLGFLLMFEKLEIPQSYILADKYEEIYWKHFLEKMTVHPGALEFLKKCKNMKIKVCLVTDMISNTQVRKIKALEISQYIDMLVTSEECGAEKPHPAMFETALKKMKASPECSIFIGDDLEKDIVGSNNFKIKNYLVNLNAK